MTRRVTTGGNRMGGARCAAPALRHRASAYLAVMYIAALGAVVAMTLSTVAVRSARTIAAESDAAQAWTLAEAGLRLVLATSKAEASWRQSRSAGVWVSSQSCGPGKFTASISEVNGGYAANPGAPVTITSTGGVGATERTLAVSARSIPLDVLRSGVHAGGTLTISSKVGGGARMTANGNVTITSSGSVDGDVASAGTVQNSGTIGGTVGQNVDPWVLPPGDWIAPYRTQAVTIPYGSLAGGGEIRDVWLSPTSNPMSGTLSPNGVYYINAAGGDVRIRDSRISGTLIIENARTVELQDALNWEAAMTGWPVLLVQSSSTDLQLNARNTLDENDLGNDYNGDGDYKDSFPCVVGGLVWTAGTAAVSAKRIEGALIADGNITISSNLALEHDADLYNNPPPGNLYESSLRIIAGTFREVMPAPPEEMQGADPIELN